MKSAERDTIDDEVTHLQSRGLRVTVVEQATKVDIVSAFTDPDAQLIITSGHGYPNGNI